jgi:hypothetical protein
MDLVNMDDYSDDVTDFAQRIIDTTPPEELSDIWVEYLGIMDINFCYEDGEIQATAYPIRITDDGYKETNTNMCRILDVE